MGYTNYLRVGVNCPASRFKGLKKDLLILLAAGDGILGGGNGEGGKPEITKDEIWFNGIGDDSYETCCLPLNSEKAKGFSFCKTSRKPYDKFVLAAYFVVKSHLKEYCRVGTDGFQSEPEVPNGYHAFCEDEVKEAYRLFCGLFPENKLSIEELFGETTEKAKKKTEKKVIHTLARFDDILAKFPGCTVDKVEWKRGNKPWLISLYLTLSSGKELSFQVGLHAGSNDDGDEGVYAVLESK